MLDQGQQVHVLAPPATSVASQGTSPPTALRSFRHLYHHLALLQHKRWFAHQLRAVPSTTTTGKVRGLLASTTSTSSRLNKLPTSCLVLCLLTLFLQKYCSIQELHFLLCRFRSLKSMSYRLSTCPIFHGCFSRRYVGSAENKSW